MSLVKARAWFLKLSRSVGDLVRLKMVSSLDWTALAALMFGVMNGFFVSEEEGIDLSGACLSASEDKVEQKRVRQFVRLVGGEE